MTVATAADAAHNEGMESLAELVLASKASIGAALSGPSI
jgi:hypothetical protein